MALRRKARTKSSKVSSAPSSGPAASGAAKSGAAAGSAASAGSAGSAAAKASSRSGGLVAQLSDPKTLRRLLLAAKVVGPAVAAGAMKTTTTVRGVLDERRARQLGVPVDDVALYKGTAGRVQARITGLTKAINDLRDRRGGDQAVARFAASTNNRLQELSAAAQATYSMPPQTQRSAVRAIAADLDQLDAELMTFLVGPPTRTAVPDGRRELTS